MLEKTVLLLFPHVAQILLPFYVAALPSWRILDLSIAMAYAMLTVYGKQNRSLAAAAGSFLDTGYVDASALQGYLESVQEVGENEVNLMEKIEHD